MQSTEGPTKGEGISFALQFLVGILMTGPKPLEQIFEGAARPKIGISAAAIRAAAEKLEVVKTIVDGREIWELIQEKKP